MGFKDIIKSIGLDIKDFYLERKAYEERQYEFYAEKYSRMNEEDLRKEYRFNRRDIVNSFGRTRAFREALEEHGMIHSTNDDE